MWKNLGEAVPEEIHKATLTVETSKLHTATCLFPSCRAGDAVPDPRLSGLAFGSHLELNPSSTRPRGRREDAGDRTGAEICVAHICLGSHHDFVEDGLSASASWPKSSLRHRTSCPKVPCGFHSEMPPWLALPRCQAASRRCQAELGSTAEVHQDMCPHVGP